MSRVNRCGQNRRAGEGLGAKRQGKEVGRSSVPPSFLDSIRCGLHHKFFFHGPNIYFYIYFFRSEKARKKSLEKRRRCVKIDGFLVKLFSLSQPTSFFLLEAFISSYLGGEKRRGGREEGVFFSSSLRSCLFSISFDFGGQQTLEYVRMASVQHVPSCRSDPMSRELKFGRNAGGEVEVSSHTPRRSDRGGKERKKAFVSDTANQREFTPPSLCPAVISNHFGQADLAGWTHWQCCVGCPSSLFLAAPLTHTYVLYRTGLPDLIRQATNFLNGSTWILDG